METKFRKSFEKDLLKIKSNDVIEDLWEVIRQAEDASSINDIRQIKKLKGSKNAYRIRVKDYRIGIFVINQIVDFARVLHRKDIYKYFP